MQELRRTYKPRRKLISGYYCTRAVNESSDPREQISRPSKEGQIKVHKSREMITEGISYSFLNSVEIRVASRH